MSLHSLALDEAGNVWAWGWSQYGQLGDGTTHPYSSLPVQALNLSNVHSIRAGLMHSLAVDALGNVWAWGWNGYGQLGDGSKTDRSLPIQVLSNVRSIAAGGSHSLALDALDNIWGWGDNGGGQLGDGTTTDHLTPVLVRNRNTLASAQP